MQHPMASHADLPLPSAELGAVMLDTLGLPAAAEWLARQFRRCTGVPCEFKVEDAGFRLPEDSAAAIFDAYLQALGDAARHASVTRVAVVLAITPHEVSVVVSDKRDGRSADTTLKVSLPLGRA